MLNPSIPIGASASLALSLSLGCSSVVYLQQPGLQMAFTGEHVSLADVSQMDHRCVPDVESIAQNEVRAYDHCNAEIPSKDLSGADEGWMRIMSLFHGSSRPIGVRIYDENGRLGGELQALPGRLLDIRLKPGNFGSMEPGYHSIRIFFFQDGHESSADFRVHFHHGDRVLSNLIGCDPIVVILP